MSELKPCPFCGGKAHIEFDYNGVIESPEKIWAYSVICERCATSSGLCCSKEKAIEAWNRRDEK